MITVEYVLVSCACLCYCDVCMSAYDIVCYDLNYFHIPSVDYGLLQKAIENQLALADLQVVQSFISKIIQLYETMQVRHGVMLVGQTGVGKTAVYKCLQKALTQLHKDGIEDASYNIVKTFVLNPKVHCYSMSMTCMLMCMIGCSYGRVVR